MKALTEWLLDGDRELVVTVTKSRAGARKIVAELRHCGSRYLRGEASDKEPAEVAIARVETSLADEARRTLRALGGEE